MRIHRTPTSFYGITSCGLKTINYITFVCLSTVRARTLVAGIGAVQQSLVEWFDAGYQADSQPPVAAAAAHA